VSWFESVKSPKLKVSKKANTNTPSGLWKKCVNCGEILQTGRLESCFHVCPYCDYHFRISALERLELLTDKGSFQSYVENLSTSNPLDFNDKLSYNDRLAAAEKKTGFIDGTLTGLAKIEGQSASMAIMNFQFMGGSMGVVTGEKIALAMDEAVKNKVPAVIVCCSGGARMQEGILSLMQMGKTSASRSLLKKAGLPLICVLTDPTTGGVAASFATQGDVTIAEPKALIGFAGPRVIEQSIRQKLPEGFQRSEFLYEHGFVDRIVHRHQLKSELAFFIKMFGKGSTNAN